jgi:preprotein translocase subunit SecA
MEDRRWSMGIHEAIETKENLELGGITKTKVSITYQNFFPLYPCFSGMTGTAKTIEKELKSIYNLKIVAIPTMKPLVRKDLSDNVFIDQSSKWKAVVEQSKKCFLEGQPLLVGTTSIEKSEFLSQLFKFANIPHELLNAKPENLKRENEIIAQAGKRYAVTIATNMAGRGTDIILGGNLDFEVSRKILEMFSKKTVEMDIIKKEYGPQEDLLFSDIQNLPYSLEDSRPSLRALYKKLLESATLKWKKENKKIKELGGLFVLGTERHETRRIDDQLRGRAGRQGDPGISQFFVSLDDDLLKIFGGSNLQNWMRYFTTEQDGPLESSFLTNSIEKAQEKVENFNYEIRKNLYEYDEILNLQAKIFFSSRKELLFQNMSKFFLYSKENHFDNFSSFSNLSFTQEFGSYSKFIFQKNSNFCSKYQYFWTQNHKNFMDLNAYHLSFSYQNFFILVDNIWNRHIEQVAYMRDTVTWKSYGQQNPLTEYNLTSFKFFSHLFQNLRKIIINFL